MNLGARIPMQVDIGFGDAVHPEPEFASFPVLLPIEPPVVRAYPREAAIAEKLNEMVVLDTEMGTVRILLTLNGLLEMPSALMCEDMRSVLVFTLDYGVLS